ncbi:IS3 family transposase [Bacillus carboniphilus]|uniref:IS3 family transposase n=1 Tax=Bacillus carboniphilus TaxID=86663 RepID=A0ABY9JP73_9BACI|nr:IS3 family transposase [Bacillus carboniphilus]WLR41215.1 IS3 family transposase [Bacillus carboniphilus]
MGNQGVSKKFNEDFKKTVVNLYHSGNSVSNLSSEYGVSEVTIYKWIKRFSPINLEHGSTVTTDDLIQLKKQMRRLQEENEIFKKGYGHIREKVSKTELTATIEKYKDQHPIQALCEVLDIPRSTYYQSLHESESNRDRENKELTKEMMEIHIDSKKRYGAPKIHMELEKKGFFVSLKRVQRLMKKAGIRSIIQRKYHPYTSQHQVTEQENLLNRDFTTTTINEKWVGDITYIHTIKDGWCYLASVMDLHSKKIIGYSFSKTMTTDLVTKALDHAYETQFPKKELIFHSDLGSQYTSEEFAESIRSKGIKHSFSRKGCPYDHACIESFHAILKKEEVHQVKYLNYQSANMALFQYIEGWYNRKRIHGGIGYRTPKEVEDSIRACA